MAARLAIGENNLVPAFGIGNVGLSYIAVLSRRPTQVHKALQTDTDPQSNPDF